MSEPQHTPETAEDFTKDADNPASLVVVYAVVIGLALATIRLSSLGRGRLALPMQLAIATVQAGLVAYYFMHLKAGERVLILTALSSIFWMGILFILFMADYMTRQYIVGW